MKKRTHIIISNNFNKDRIMKRFISTLMLLLLTIVLLPNDAMGAAPSRQARYISFSTVTSTSFTVSWLNGNGAQRMVVVGTSSADISNNPPATDALYGANAAYLSGANLGASAYCVFNILTRGRIIARENAKISMNSIEYCALINITS